MKFVSVVLVFAASLASTGAVVFPRVDAHETGKLDLAGYTKRDVPCNAQQLWQVNLAYSAGQQVVFNDSLWTANQWNYNSPPGNPAVAWTLVDACTPPVVINPANCTGISPWNATTAYVRGSEVIFNGRLWTSVQWTYSNSPGDASGSWRDGGAC